ncbi:uncharacterized protein MELLADRAFT_69355 [Melampsora larici-populina 98AG31]|uniref:Uncharacterized protein n=1 Tax=Melampsora larici-populina (strain 98AG31 / pathotype 3-4-7) TaxID=747676 RepID=F4SAE5_MELLP|nr:uncharacterized protein MELLADRAFT_69355 [Melampsora larici-populina 98AG31]EGF98371.1 hypothetical protein MELLADRAFT_69355 [Melampsora larici-populina 98AG31]
MSASPSNRRVSHPVYISACWEVSGMIASTLNANVGYRVGQTGISCGGIEGNDAHEHPTHLTSFSGSGTAVTVGEMYFAKGKFFAPNNPTPSNCVHEFSHVVHLGNSEAFPGALINNTAVSSIGIILSKRVIQEPAHDGKPTTICIVRHTDYNPVTGTNIGFQMEYWCRPVRNLAKVQNLFQQGREMTIMGYVTGKDVARHMWQVDVYAISVATGAESVSTPNGNGTAGVAQTTAAGRVRLPRYTAPVPSSSGSVGPVASTSSSTADPLNVATPQDDNTNTLDKAALPSSPSTGVSSRAQSKRCESYLSVLPGHITQVVSVHMHSYTGSRLQHHGLIPNRIDNQFPVILPRPASIFLREKIMNDKENIPLRPRAPKRAKLGLAVANQQQNTEESIMKRLRNEIPHHLGAMDDACSFCGALHWISERPTSAKVNGPHAYTSCCRGGKIKPPVDYFGDHVVPDFVRDLLTGTDPGMSPENDDNPNHTLMPCMTRLG